MADTSTTLAPTDAEISELEEAHTKRHETRDCTGYWSVFNIRSFTRAVLAKWGAPAPASSEPVAVPAGLETSPATPAAQGDALEWLQPQDTAALNRFAETSDDDESYDISKAAVARLTGFGCLQSRGFGKYSITDFGHYVLNDWAHARDLPFKTQPERDAIHREAIAARAAKGE